ncbi:MAG: hypothetical protein ABEH83_06715 [Halobacterium sp.]
MPNWRVVGAGVAAFLVALSLAVAYRPPTVLLAGFAGGAVAGLLAGSARSGLWHGSLVGVVELTVVVVGLVAVLAGYDPEYARPGIGYAIVLVPALGAAFAVEAAVAGAVCGALR